MSDMPESIWYYPSFGISVYKSPTPCEEYIRADIHQSKIAELEKRINNHVAFVEILRDKLAIAEEALKKSIVVMTYNYTMHPSDPFDYNNIRIELEEALLQIRKGDK